MGDRLAHGGRLFALVLFGKKSGVGLHLGQEIRHRAIGCMDQSGGEGSELHVFCDDFFMDGVIGKPGGQAVVQAHDGVGVPAAAPTDPFAIEIVASVDLVDPSLVKGKLEDFIGKFWR